MSEPQAVHETYRKLLESPAVRTLAARFRLHRGVQYQWVGERRSFHGKAGIVKGVGIVRLPGNARPEPYLLLTLLHEWAHLLAQREAKGRRIFPHGKEWRSSYLALATAAVEMGLFPGNEEVVLRHAAAGQAQTRQCRLLGAGGKPLLPESPRPEARFRVGDAVRFRDRQGQWVRGVVRRLNQRTYTVVADDNRSTFRVAYAYTLIIAADDPLPLPHEEIPWHPGCMVELRDPKGGVLQGFVTRVNSKTLSVQTQDGRRWRVRFRDPSLRRLSV